MRNTILSRRWPDMVKLLTRGIERNRGEPRKVIGNYGVVFFKSTPVVSLTSLTVVMTGRPTSRSTESRRWLGPALLHASALSRGRAALELRIFDYER